MITRDFEQSVSHNSVQCEEQGRTLSITLSEEFRNSTWATYWGSIQAKLRNSVTKYEYVIINAQRLEWVDPFPMLSLLIAMAEIPTEIKIYYVVADKDSITDKQKQAIEFLEKEGFFEEMKKYGIRIIDSSFSDLIYSDKDIREQEEILRKRINEYNGFLTFRDCTILKARVVDLADYSSENQIDGLVNKELEQARHRIRQHLPENLMNEIIWKTDLFLKETINNVFEHAYEGLPHKYVGYYIRHRIGLMDNSLDAATLQKYKKHFLNEYYDVQCFTNSFPSNTSSFIEVFVIDAGVGLTSHYYSKKSGNTSMSLRAVWRETIGDGKRSPNIRKYTKFGGLYTLSRLLNNEFLIARDFDCWTGSDLPVRKINDFYIKANNNPDGIDVQGLALMCRIAFKKAMDNKGWVLTDETGRRYQEALKEERGVYEKYFDSSFRKLDHTLSYIKDNRVDASFIQKYLEQKDGVDLCVFLPSENVSKNLIYDKIGNLGIKNKSRAIIIADIPVNECGLYQLALEKASFGTHFTSNIDRIVLISQRLSVRILVRNTDNEYVFNESETNSYIGRQPSVFAPHLSLFHALEWLKTHDSMLVWQYIAHKNNTERFYVNQPVTWYRGNDETELHGYLDFEKTLTDSFLKRMYRNALLRTLCLSPKLRCEYSSNDPLMTELVDFMKNVYYNTLYETGDVTIQLCSVFVSGVTQTGDNPFSINMYLHKNSDHYIEPNSVMHLFAWPGVDIFPRDSNEEIKHYKRVGATYAIAPFGWRYFPVPRYKALDSDGTKIKANYYYFNKSTSGLQFKSIYKCPPKETYAYWQGKNGLFMGISHVEYESKHDILNFNIPFIVKESFLLGGDLACFLLGEIATLMRLDVEKINFHGNIKFAEDVKRYVQERLEKDHPKKCSLLVYPYHSNTEKVLDCIKEYLAEYPYPIMIVPLIPINKERNGVSFQPSPLTLEMLRDVIDQYAGLKDDNAGEVNALFFDDSIVDGKTQDEIKQIMYGLGVRHVVSMFILERRRIPFNTSDDTRISAFWRLDIPRLGTKQNCPLCAVLNTISDFSAQLISVQAQNRVNMWNEVWKNRTENALDRIRTIDSRIIHLKNPRKRFGIYFEGNECKQCGGDEQRIELINSIGLTLYMGELLGITSRDDKMLQYCSKEYGLDAFTILEMLCTNLLLYGRTISLKVRERIVEEIFMKANEIDDCNNHTAYAALVLMTQDEPVLRILKNKYDEMRMNNHRPNYDMLILLSYLGMHYKMHFSKDADEFDEPEKLRRMEMSNDRAYQLFHSAMFNGHGKKHNCPIGRLIEGAISTEQDIRRAIDALDSISYAFDHIFDWNLTDWNQSYNASIGYVKDLINNKKRILLDLKWEDFVKKKQYYINEMQSLFDLLSKIHERLFIPLDIIHPGKPLTSRYTLYERMQKWASSPDYDLGFVNFNRPEVGWINIFEQWVIWDRDIDIEIGYLLTNAHEHSSGVFSMNETGFVGEEMHKVWSSVEYDIEGHSMSLLLYNKSENNAAHIRKETEKKERYGKNHLHEMNVTVVYNDMPDNIIETRIIFKLV